MSGESFERSLAQRAGLAMRADDRGRGFVGWARLTAMTSLDVRAALESMVEEGAAMGLEVVFTEAVGGIFVHWRPRRRS